MHLHLNLLYKLNINDNYIIQLLNLIVLTIMKTKAS